MSLLSRVPPSILKDVLIHAGCELIEEDTYNWVLMKAGQPLVIPKMGLFVAVEVIERCLHRAGLTPEEFFRLLAEC